MKMWILSQFGDIREVEATRTTDKCFWYMQNDFSGKPCLRRQLRVTDYKTAHESRELAVGAHLARLEENIAIAEEQVEYAKEKLAKFIEKEGLSK